LIVQAAGEAERLKARIGVGNHISEVVIVYLFHNCSRIRINNHSGATEVVTDNPKGPG
jgi:hypothetical protein